jgi:hypothetical protein
MRECLHSGYYASTRSALRSKGRATAEACG